MEEATHTSPHFEICRGGLTIYWGTSDSTTNHSFIQLDDIFREEFSILPAIAPGATSAEIAEKRAIIASIPRGRIEPMLPILTEDLCMCIPPLVHNGKQITDEAEQALLFAKIFTKVSTCEKGKKKEPRCITKRDCAGAPEVTIKEIQHALSSLSEGAAAGCDGICPEELHHLPPEGIEAIRMIISRSIRSGECPRDWKKGIIIPILKERMPPEDPLSYIPVCLTSSIAKVAERVIYTRLCSKLPHLSTIGAFPYKKGKATEDALCQMVSRAKQAVSNNRALTAVMVDFSKEIDKVHPETLLDILMDDLRVEPYICRWIRNFLEGRVTEILVGDTTCPVKIKVGIPQGTVLGPLLFTVYLERLLNNLCLTEVTPVCV
eukprot:Tbor_TRINITY_DN5793_c0_g1::TRINITY_DN5793_c0_g1_i4::g.20263::m.20263